MNNKVIIAIVAVVLVGGLFFMMRGDSPEALIDDTIAMTEECMKVAFSGDEKAMKECDEKSKDLEKRWDAALKDMSDEEKAEWEKKLVEAVAKKFPGLSPK